MSLQPLVILATPTVWLADALKTQFTAAAHRVIVAPTFPEAKGWLETHRDMLITELRLAAYNGLHLAMRAAECGTPAIVLGEPDRLFEAEAERHHALYVPADTDPARIVSMAALLTENAGRTRRSPRKRVLALEAFANDEVAHVLDVSHEGIRIEPHLSAGHDLPSHFMLRLPLYNFSCPVQRVWVRPSGEPNDPACCGATLLATDPETLLAWREIVDRLSA